METKNKRGRGRPPKQFDRRHLGNNRKYTNDEDRKKAITKSQTKYTKNHYRVFTIKIPTSKYQNIIDKLVSLDNITEYIEKLIINDIKKESD